MRNKKLFNLTESARTASEELTTYLRHLDARETDASYVHARMLFDEGWRMRFSPLFPAESFALWMDADEGQSPAIVYGDEPADEKFLSSLQLTNVPSSKEILCFLTELTEEVGIKLEK